MHLIVPAGTPLHGKERQDATEPPQLPPDARPETGDIPFRSLDKRVGVVQKTEGFPTEKGGPGDVPHDHL